MAMGGFITAKYIATNVQNGDTIHIGKVKIKNADDTSFMIYPDSYKDDEGIEKSKKQKRKERRQKDE